MRRQILARTLRVVLGIGVGLAAVPGCGPDGSEGAKPSADSTAPTNVAAARPTGSAPNPTSAKKVDTTSRRQHQKSSQ